MKGLFLAILFLTSHPVFSQSINPPLSAFENLIGDTWKANGAWGDGSVFEQKVTFESGLSGNLIKTKTWGNVSHTGYEFGLRSEGVRFWNSSDSVLTFFEFDVFGSAIDGEIVVDGKDIYLSYFYDFGSGPMKLTDAWLYTSENEYEFIVGVFDEGEWKQKYISAPFKRISK